jgi:hypothetical protein
MIKVMAHYFTLFAHQLQQNSLSRAHGQMIDAAAQELKQIWVYALRHEPTEFTFFVDVVQALQRLALNDQTRLEMYRTRTMVTVASSKARSTKGMK